MISARKGDWKQTYTGKMFWPLDPRPEDVDIFDIAHALSLICRFGWHCKRHYSVAEHSIHVARLVDRRFELQALLHDAAEAYVGDMVAPLKRHMPEFCATEDAVARAIGERFGVVLHPLPPEVKRADMEMLAIEARDLMGPPPRDWVLPYPPPPGLSLNGGTPPEIVCGIFIHIFEKIRPTRAGGRS